MYEDWQITGNSLKTVQGHMISMSIYCQLFSLNYYCLLLYVISNVFNLLLKQQFYPIQLSSMFTPNKTELSQNYQDHIGTGSSTALKMKYLQDKLQMKEKKLEMLQAKVQEQQNYIQILQSRESKLQKAHKDKQICIEKLVSKIDKLQRELAENIGRLGQKDREVRKKQIEQIKQKQVHQHEEKLNKMLTKQNHDLISQRHSLKSQIKVLTQNLEIKQTELQCQKQQVSLLMKLNQQLKLQVQELLFQIRMLNRRKQTNRLQDYQQKIDDRHQQTKQNENNENEDKQLLQLLRLKIGSLQQQLEVSERRCKQLQLVILSQ